MFDNLTLAALNVLADVPSLGNGEQPPGFSKVLTVLRWLFYLVGVAGVVGMLICAGTMMVQHRRGGMGEHGAAIGMVFGGCLLAALSVPLVNGMM